MRNTPIEWCDDTVNAVMGCNPTCELWPSRQQVIDEIVRVLKVRAQVNTDDLRPDVAATIDRFSDELLKDQIALAIRSIAAARQLGLSERQLHDAIVEAKEIIRCYAGNLSEKRAGKNTGYPNRFDEPALFPGRMIKAAVARDLTGTERPDKPWLNGLRRHIFISDMGDAMSSDVPFEFLYREIINTAASEKGRRHQWLWVTKKPDRMAAFSQWLEERGVSWPDNVMAMTSVTGQNTAFRVRQLERVRCQTRGLSVEPLWTPVTIPLENIDWVIIGGESGARPKPFHLEWARDVREQCRQAQVPIFVKQFGANAFVNGRPLRLRDSHGGDWNEWPGDLRIREMPRVADSPTTRTRQLETEALDG